jgi:hypothetical protein
VPEQVLVSPHVESGTKGWTAPSSSVTGRMNPSLPTGSWADAPPATTNKAATVNKTTIRAFISLPFPFAILKRDIQPI